MRNVFLTALFSALFQLGKAQIPNADSLIALELKRLRIPGLAAAKVENGRIRTLQYFGYQNLEMQIPVTGQTIFHVASISKTITAAAVMQLHSRGHFGLDDDVNRFLPFRIANPLFPDVAITFRQLLRHRSSIADNMEYLLPFWENEYHGADIPLDAFLRDYLSKDGRHYDGNKNFAEARPGAEFGYSNMGFALLGYLVERIAQMPFDQYCQEHLFNPLEMNASGWFANRLRTDRLAVPYSYSDSLRQYASHPQGAFPDYPSGSLRCTLGDLAKFLACWSNDGTYLGKTVIDAAAVQALAPKDMSLGFHTWFMYLLNTETPMYSHNGHGPGVSTYMLYDPFSKKGLVILMNGELTDYFGWRKLIDLLYNS